MLNSSWLAVWIALAFTVAPSSLTCLGDSKPSAAPKKEPHGEAHGEVKKASAAPKHDAERDSELEEKAHQKGSKSKQTGHQAAVGTTNLVTVSDGKMGRLDIGTNLVIAKPRKKEMTAENAQTRIEMGRKQRLEKNYEAAELNLMDILNTTSLVEYQRLALLELAYVAQDARQLTKAQHYFSEYSRRFAQDSTIPEVLLRQGLLYREMGAPDMAVSKFFSVMSSALNLKLGEMEYYQLLVLQAQSEIAETRYQQGNYAEAEDFLHRLLKLDHPQLNKPLIESKLLRAMAKQDRRAETIAEARNFLRRHPNSSDVAEVRFLLADALKKSGQNREAMQEVLILLEGEQELAQSHPENWEQWKQRAGNDIANQLYQEGDFVNALAIYSSLAQSNAGTEWQLSVLYQIGLIYERMRQSEKAMIQYQQITQRSQQLTNALPPSVTSVIEMAKWRHNHLRWLTNSELESVKVRAQVERVINVPEK